MRLKELVQDGKRIGSAEHKTLPIKGMELVDIMIRRRINITFLQETKRVDENLENLEIYDVDYGVQEKKYI